MVNGLVSIIVPTKNSEKYLDRCLVSLKQQTYNQIEIIVVDNFSEDKTAEIAKRYSEKVFLKGPERSTQRNYGASVAQGEFVYFVDSDFVVEPTVVAESVNKSREGFELIAIHNTSDPTVSIWSKVRKFERDMYKYDTNNIATSFMTKEAFDSINGYNEQCVASEDYDLHNRLLRKGYNLGFVEPEEVHLGEPKTLWEIYKKHYYYGKTLVSYIKNNKDKAFKQLSPVRPGFLRNKKAFLKRPGLSFLFFIYMFVKYLAGFNGMVVNAVAGLFRKRK